VADGQFDVVVCGAGMAGLCTAVTALEDADYKVALFRLDAGATLTPAQVQSTLGKASVVMRASIGSAVDVTVNGIRQQPQTATDPMELTWTR